MELQQYVPNKKWNKENYKEFIKYLMSVQDTEYREFHSSLVLNSKYDMIGIRVPIMRNIAKEIAKGNIEEFLTIAQDKYYEEVMIQGLTISHIKDEKLFYKYFSSYFLTILIELQKLSHKAQLSILFMYFLKYL